MLIVGLKEFTLGNMAFLSYSDAFISKWNFCNVAIIPLILSRESYGSLLTNIIRDLGQTCIFFKYDDLFIFLKKFIFTFHLIIHSKTHI